MFLNRQRAVPLQRQRWQQVLLLINVALACSSLALWLMVVVQGLFWRADFTMFYTGASIVHAGEGSRLYDFTLQTNLQQQILGGRSFRDGLLPFNYPPYVAVIFAPLSWLSLVQAYYLWAGIQAFLLILLLSVLWQVAKGWGVNERLLLVSAVAAFPPLFSTFALGSVSLVVLICLLQFYRSLKEGRDIEAGVWLALGTVKPQMILLPVIVVLATRRWRALASFSLIMGGLVALMSLWFGPRIWVAFLQTLRLTNGFFDRYGIVPEAMYNLKGTLALLLGSTYASPIIQISTFAFGVVALLVFWLWYGHFQPQDPCFELRLGLTLLLGLLFSPHLNPQDGIALVAPLLLFSLYLLSRRSLTHNIYASFVLLWPLLFFVGEWTIGGRLGVRIPVLLMSVLLIAMLWAFVKEQRSVGALIHTESVS